MIRGCAIVVLLILNLTFWGTVVVALGVAKFVVQLIAPRSWLRRQIILTIVWLAATWVSWNNRIFDALLPTTWDVAGLPDDLDPLGHYLLISNHQSWVDIFVLQRVFAGRAAFSRFFLKQELIWFPILGQACWALEFPFMKRYSAEYVERYPHQRGKDLETTRRACQRYRHVPVTIASFIEGTRGTREKQIQQKSPYRHLLPPRTGGISYVLASLGDQLDAVLDVTLAYPGKISVWRFVTGEVPAIHVRVRRVEVPQEFLTAAVTERGPLRDRFRTWANELWGEKDELLEQMKGPPGAAALH